LALTETNRTLALVAATHQLTQANNMESPHRTETAAELP
jgi:hypothetical protein